MPDYRKETPDYGKPVKEETAQNFSNEQAFDPVVVFPSDEENKEEE